MAIKFALVGDPVEHSLSPSMHHAAMAKIGLNGSYTLLRCDTEGFAEVVAELRAGAYDGLNVTMPHKLSAFRECDRLTEAGEASGSVNTLKSDASELWGHSSDLVAFVESYRAVGPVGDLVILGGGGSARAAVAAHDGEAQVWARRPEQVTALQQVFGERVRPWSHTPPGTIVVNCTPLGMRGEIAPVEVVGDPGGVIDLPYRREETPLAATSRKHGIPVVDGKRFLALQAAESFQWWTGEPIDPDTMERAARKG